MDETRRGRSTLEGEVRGMEVSEADEIKRLRDQNARLKKLVAELSVAEVGACKDLEHKVAWAREAAKRREFPITLFQDSIEFQGDDLSRQFGRATAFAKIYHARGFSENDFWEDTASLCRLLAYLYEEERLGRDPFPEPPAIRSGQDEID